MNSTIDSIFDAAKNGQTIAVYENARGVITYKAGGLPWRERLLEHMTLAAPIAQRWQRHQDAQARASLTLFIVLLRQQKNTSYKDIVHGPAILHLAQRVVATKALNSRIATTLIHQCGQEIRRRGDNFLKRAVLRQWRAFHVRLENRRARRTADEARLKLKQKGARRVIATLTHLYPALPQAAAAWDAGTPVDVRKHEIVQTPGLSPLAALRYAQATHAVDRYKAQRLTRNFVCVIAPGKVDGGPPERRYFPAHRHRPIAGLTRAYLKEPRATPHADTTGQAKTLLGRQDGIVSLRVFNRAHRRYNANEDIQKLGISTAIVNHWVRHDTVLSLDGGKSLDCLREKLPIASFRLAAGDLKKFHQGDTYLMDIKPDNLVIGGKHISFIDIDGRIIRNKMAFTTVTPQYCTHALADAAIFGTDPARRIRARHLVDDLCFLRCVIWATTTDNTLAAEVTRMPDNNGTTMNRGNEALFASWIKQHVLEQYQPYTRQLLSDPVGLSIDLDTPLFDLVDVLQFDAKA